MRKRVVAAAVATVVVALGAGSASAADYIYWSSDGPSSSIGRANVDGSSPNEAFIASRASMSAGVAVDASSIYWLSGATPRTLAKASLDGSGVDANLGTIGNTFTGSGIALLGSSIYLPSPALGNQQVARIGTDGSGLTTSLTSTVNIGATGAVAADANFLYIAPATGSAIARANLDGSGVDNSFVTGVPNARGIAAAGGYAYWTTPSTIGRIKADGTDRQVGFVSGLTQGGWGIAVSSEYIYWGWGGSGTYGIGRTKLDGTGSDRNFITGLTQAVGQIAVTAGSGTSPSPAPTPTPTPTPTPVATTLATPTVNTNTPGPNAVVTVRTQLGAKGKYTFIFEKPSANEMSREQATSSRVAMQKGTRIGKRTLKKRYTAAVITTTADNAKVVTRSLLRKAQAKKLIFRVVYAPTGTAQSESVIKIK